MTDEKTYGSDIGFLARRKLYAEMTDLGEIARRYFVMNFFDGVLTVLGIVIGSFILFLGDFPPTKLEVIAPALATSVAIGISGISGGFLSERAERKRKIIDMQKAMALHFEDSNKEDDSKKYKDEDYYPVNPIKEFELDELEKPEIEHISVDPESPELLDIPRKQKQEKTLAEKAERYASGIASLINGFSPAIGGLAVVIPFFFSGKYPNGVIYTISFVLIVLLLFSLGAFLARISKDSIIKYGIKMTMVGILTAGLAFLLSFFTSN